LDIPRLKLIEKECQLALLVDGKIDCMLQVLEALGLDLVAVTEVDDELAIMAPLASTQALLESNQVLGTA
jgi:hypothetical protein